MAEKENVLRLIKFSDIRPRANRFRACFHRDIPYAPRISVLVIDNHFPPDAHPWSNPKSPFALPCAPFAAVWRRRRRNYKFPQCERRVLASLSLLFAPSPIAPLFGLGSLLFPLLPIGLSRREFPLPSRSLSRVLDPHPRSVTVFLALPLSLCLSFLSHSVWSHPAFLVVRARILNPS